MGLFDRLKKPHQSTPVAPSVEHSASSTLNLDKAEASQTLSLRKETFDLSLRKKSMENVVARVALAMDKSGSMDGLYRNGTVQAVVERLLPVGLRLDDNGELDMWAFANHCRRLKSVTEREFYDYVNRHMLSGEMRHFSGGTEYAPVINDIVKKYVHEEPSEVPTFIIFITDGENADHDAAKRAITQAAKHNIFFQFIGIGHENFRFLKMLDTMDGRYIDNANFFEIKDINRISDDQLYDMLLNEYPSWEKEARKVGLVR